MRCDRAGVPTLIAKRSACTALVAALAACASHPRTALVPLGGGSTCVVTDSTAATRDTIYVVGAEQSPPKSIASECIREAAVRGPEVVTETPGPAADLRDVLDRGIPGMRAPRPDVVVTRDPNVLAYAASGAEYFTVALTYDRTYVLAVADSSSGGPLQDERDALARDAVTADTRGATPPFAWFTDANCSAPFASSPKAPRSVVAYASGDVIARQLAERIVALAGSRTGSAWLPMRLTLSAATPRVVAVDLDSIADELASGRAAAAVVAVPRDPRARCGTPNAPLPWRGVPLVDSRAHAIVRRGSGAAFIINDDGTLRFVRRNNP